MYKKMYNISHRCVSMVRFGASVDCEPVFSVVVYTAVQTNVARNAFRDAPTML